MPRNSFSFSQKAKVQTGLYQCCIRRVTRGTALQARSVRSDERGIAHLPGLTNTHFERAAHDVASVELHVN